MVNVSEYLKAHTGETPLSDYLPPGLVETRLDYSMRPIDAPENPDQFQKWMSEQICERARRL